MLHRLSEMKKGEKGVIQKFEETESKVKLLEMGFLPGEMIRVENIAPLGDPMAVSVTGYSISLRKQDARYIWVELIVPGKSLQDI